MIWMVEVEYKEVGREGEWKDWGLRKKKGKDVEEIQNKNKTHKQVARKKKEELVAVGRIEEK